MRDEVRRLADSTPRVPAQSGPGRQIPDDLGALGRQLGALVDSARDYVVRHPEAAAAGGWWNAEPVTEPPSSPVMTSGEAREAAVLMLFCTGSGGGPEVLLTERSAGLKKHPGQIAFPGGAKEDFDVDAVAVALREAQEEVGLDVDRLTVPGTLPAAPVPVSGFMVSPVPAVVDDPGVLTPQLGEVERVLQVPAAELVAPENRFSSALRRRGVTLKAPAFLLGDTLIWGFTGILLDRVLDRLGWAVAWDAGREVDPREYQTLL